METIKLIAIAYLLGVVSFLIPFAMYLVRKQKPVINADQYIAEQEQKVGKVKQKGEGNEQTTRLDQILSKRDIRKQNREERRARRKASVLSNSTVNKEL